MVWIWMQEFRHRITDDFGPKTMEGFVGFSIDVQARARTFGVWRGEELGGLLVIERQSPVLAVSQLLFKRSFWGRETTVTAAVEVYARMFRDGVRKIASVVFSDNHAMRDMARLGGAEEEGLFRDHTMRGGKAASVIALGMTRADFEERWGKLEDWDADNGTSGARGVRGEHDGGEDVHERHDEHPLVHAGAERDAVLARRFAREPPGERGEHGAGDDGGDGFGQ